MIEKKIKLKGVRLYYKETGEGRPIILLHGWESSSDVFLKVQEYLAKKGFKVFILDLPGFGKSASLPSAWGVGEYADLVLKFADSLGLDKFFLIGHSFGGRISIKLAANHPERVLGLVLCSSAGARRPFKRFIFFVLAKVGKLLFSLPGLCLFRQPSRKLLYFLARERDYYKARGVMRETMKKVISEDLTLELGKIKMPTLITWGANDQVTPMAHAKILREKIKGAVLKIVPDATHKLPYEKPEQFGHLVVEFLRSIQ